MSVLLAKKCHLSLLQGSSECSWEGCALVTGLPQRDHQLWAFVGEVEGILRIDRQSFSVPADASVSETLQASVSCVFSPEDGLLCLTNVFCIAVQV